MSPLSEASLTKSGRKTPASSTSTKRSRKSSSKGSSLDSSRDSSRVLPDTTDNSSLPRNLSALEAKIQTASSSAEAVTVRARNAVEKLSSKMEVLRSQMTENANIEEELAALRSNIRESSLVARRWEEQGLVWEQEKVVVEHQLRQLKEDRKKERADLQRFSQVIWNIKSLADSSALPEISLLCSETLSELSNSAPSNSAPRSQDTDVSFMEPIEPIPESWGNPRSRTLVAAARSTTTVTSPNKRQRTELDATSANDFSFLRLMYHQLVYENEAMGKQLEEETEMWHRERSIMNADCFNALNRAAHMKNALSALVSEYEDMAAEFGDLKERLSVAQAQEAEARSLYELAVDELTEEKMTQEKNLESLKDDFSHKNELLEETMDEAKALRFANDVVIQEMKEQRERLENELQEARKEGSLAKISAEQEAAKWRELMDSTVATLKKQLMAGLQESVQKIQSLKLQLSVSQKENTELKELLAQHEDQAE